MKDTSGKQEAIKMVPKVVIRKNIETLAPDHKDDNARSSGQRPPGALANATAARPGDVSSNY